jgi:hypothetical protein
VTVGARLPNPAFPRAVRPSRPAPASAPMPARSVYVRPFPVARRRSRYDRWVGPVVILSVLIFCAVMGVAGWNLVQHALQH